MGGKAVWQFSREAQVLSPTLCGTTDHFSLRCQCELFCYRCFSFLFCFFFLLHPLTPNFQTQVFSIPCNITVTKSDSSTSCLRFHVQVKWGEYFAWFKFAVYSWPSHIITFRLLQIAILHSYWSANLLSVVFISK